MGRGSKLEYDCVNVGLAKTFNPSTRLSDIIIPTYTHPPTQKPFTSRSNDFV